MATLKRYTVTRTVTVVERWYNIEAASPEAAQTLLEDGHIQRPSDKEDGFNEFVEAEADDKGPGTYALVGEFTKHERALVARLFSTTIPAAEHDNWTISNGHGTLCSCTPPFDSINASYCAVERGGVLALYSPSVRELCQQLADIYLGKTTDESGNNRCTSWSES